MSMFYKNIIFWSLFFVYLFIHSLTYGAELPQNYLISSGTLLDGFETASQTDWTYDGAAGGSKADNTDSRFIKEGSRSLKITSGSAASSNGSAIKTISQNLDSCGAIGIWVYIEDVSKLNTVVLYVSSNWPTSFFAGTPEPGGTTNQLVDGWNFLTVAKADWSNTGGESWTNTMTRIRVRINSDAVTGPSIAYFDSWRCLVYTRPKVLLTFDDGARSVYTNIFDYMRDRDIPGTLYLIGSNLENPTSTQLTIAMIQEMYDAGWDVADHTFTHTNLVSGGLTQQQIEQEFLTNRQEFLKRGWTRGIDHCSYPNGAFDSTVFLAAAAVNMKTCRSTQNTIGQINPYNVEGNKYDLAAINIADGNSVATVTGYVDTAIKQGKSAILLFHNVQDVAGFPIANMQAVIDYIYQRRDQIDAVTISEWYDGLRDPRKRRTN